MEALKSRFYIPLHLTERLLERFGILLTPALYREMQEQVKEGRAEKLLDQENGRQVYRMLVEGTEILAVYDPEGNMFVTVMHKSWVQFVDGQWVEKYRDLAKHRNKRNRANTRIRLNKKRVLKGEWYDDEN